MAHAEKCVILEWTAMAEEEVLNMDKPLCLFGLIKLKTGRDDIINYD